MDKLLILGINGFTGKHMQRFVAERISTQAYEVIGVDRQIDPVAPIQYIEADLTKKDDLIKVLTTTRPDYIINLVGIFQRQISFDKLLAVNALITKQMFETIQSKKIKVKKTLIVGSAAEYGYKDALPIKETHASIPMSEYGLAKSIQTDIALYYHSNYHLKVNIARPFNIIGKNISGDLAIGAFVKQIKETEQGGTIYVGNLQSKRDYLDISDVIDAYFSILEKGVDGKTYNVCSGRSHRMEDILNQLIATSKKEIHLARNSTFINKNDISDIYGDNTQLKTDTGWMQRVDIPSALASAMCD